MTAPIKNNSRMFVRSLPVFKNLLKAVILQEKQIWNWPSSLENVLEQIDEIITKKNNGLIIHVRLSV